MKDADARRDIGLLKLQVNHINNTIESIRKDIASIREHIGQSKNLFTSTCWESIDRHNAYISAICNHLEIGLSSEPAKVVAVKHGTPESGKQ